MPSARTEGGVNTPDNTPELDETKQRSGAVDGSCSETTRKAPRGRSSGSTPRHHLPGTAFLAPSGVRMASERDSGPTAARRSGRKRPYAPALAQRRYT
jgi:hypothetical protein